MFPRATTARRRIRGCLLHETIRRVRDGAAAELRVILCGLLFCPWSCLLTSATSFLIQSEGWTLPWCPAFTFPLKSPSTCVPHELHSGSITSSSPADSSLRAPLHLCQTHFFPHHSLSLDSLNSSDYCLYIISEAVRITFYPRVVWDGCFTHSSTGLSPFGGEHLLPLISS